MREFAFEVRLCAHLEEAYPVVARQLGASVGAGGARRVMDLVLVEAGPEFDDRVRLSASTIPPAAVESDVGVGRWRRVTDALDGPPERCRRVAERAADVGFFELARRGGHAVARRAASYPDWVGRLVGVENKPDLADPGDLYTQLRKDVSLGLFDAVVLATESHVTRAHLNRLPAEVGVWRVAFDDEDPVTVVREPAPLDAAGPGLQVVERHPGRTDVRPVSPGRKAAKRRAVAERAYGKGWRTYALPACENARRAGAAGTDSLPGCAHYDRVVDPASECGPDCPGFAAGDPPAVDADAERAARTPWDPDPPGAARRQAGLDAFRGEDKR
ncbi:MAG: DUF5787 family protein [Halobacteriaceae archaeon]